MNGLILCGGQSNRMGQPKSLLLYRGKPQYQQAAALLSVCCDQVFISCRAEQQSWFVGYPTLPDTEEYGDIGLLNGVLSAYESTLGTDTRWFVLGCDYPLLEASDLRQLVEARNPNRVATVFCHPDTHFVEPLVGIYEASAGLLLKKWLEAGNESLRLFLETHEAQKIAPAHPEHLKSVDTPDEYHKISKAIGS